MSNFLTDVMKGLQGKWDHFNNLTVNCGPGDLTKEQIEKRNALFDRCQSLGLPLEAICGDRVPGGFDRDEQIVFCLPNVKLMEPRAVRYSTGRSGGSSVRIMKGFSIRTGGYAGQSESVEQLRDID